MINYLYNDLKKEYGENVSLLYMDTDSFILDRKTDDVYKDMKKILEYMIQVILVRRASYFQKRM